MQRFSERLVAGAGLLLYVALSAAPAPAEEIARPTARRIHHLPINNSAADTTTRDTQIAPTIVDLGGGKLVAAWTDSGSFDGTTGGTTDHFTGYAWSSNNGLSWTDGGTLHFMQPADGGRPSLAYSASDKIVYLATEDSSLGATIRVYRSEDDGHTFGESVNGAPGGSLGSLTTEGTVVQMVVDVRLNHPEVDHLHLSLISPLGETVDLATNDGFGDGANFGSGANNCSGTKTSFDDLAAVSILDGASPYNGSFKPEQPMATILGSPSDGQ